MEDTYLVEIRLGRTKWRIRQLISSITGPFGIEQFMEPHPHVTLFGPLVLNGGVRQEQILDAIESVVSRYDPVPFLPDGQSLKAWDAEPERKWFHVTVANRLDLRKAASVFPAITRDPSPGKSTGGSASIITRIRKHLIRLFTVRPRSFPPPLLDETGLRVTVMHGEEILAEYDLAGKRWIHDDHRHDSTGWQDTLA